MTAIVASGYLFTEDQAYHVDVYQGDTPACLLDRHTPGAQVKRAAVLDIDVPGQTLPLEIQADEPVVVVGASPRTSVFVYGEVPSVSPDVVALKDGKVVSAPAPPTVPTKTNYPPLAEQEAVVVKPATTEGATNDGGSSAEDQAAAPAKARKDERFAKTRRLRKPRADRGTRKAPRVIEIELA